MEVSGCGFSLASLGHGAPLEQVRALGTFSCLGQSPIYQHVHKCSSVLRTHSCTGSVYWLKATLGHRLLLKLTVIGFNEPDPFVQITSHSCLRAEV